MTSSYTSSHRSQRSRAWSHVTNTSPGKHSRKYYSNAVHTCCDTIASWITGINTHITPLLFAPHFKDLCENFPIVLIGFAVVIVQLQRSQNQTEPLANAVSDLSAVPGRYGSGAYYAWLINASIVAFKPDKTTLEAQYYALVATLGTATYAVTAAIDQLIRSLGLVSYSQPILDASDRVNQVGWVIATFYLLHRYFKEPLVTPRPVILSCSTAIWMLAWLSHAVAMVTYSITRGDLGTRVLKCGIPFLVGIPLPLATIYILKHYDLLHWDHPNWPLATVNMGALAIAVAYILTPRQLRYDADSPTAPLAAPNMTNGDQVATLLAGLMFVVPHLFLAWDGGRIWVADRLRTIRFKDIITAVTVAGKEFFFLCMRGMMQLLERVYKVGKWLRECVISFSRAIGIRPEDRSAPIEMASHGSHERWYDSM